MINGNNSMRTLASITLLCFAVLCRAGSENHGAERHALLVGVSEYTHLDQRLWLKGPTNDVALMRRLLQERGFKPHNIRVLGVEPERQPTRALILEELQRLAGITTKGDFVYLHFSGHGSQQPAGDAADEPDKLDEIFLPADVGAWEQGIGSVKNAIVDNEVGAAITAIRQGGAFVWAVFDSCLFRHHDSGLYPAYGAQPQAGTRQIGDTTHDNCQPR